MTGSPLALVLSLVMLAMLAVALVARSRHLRALAPHAAEMAERLVPRPWSAPRLLASARLVEQPDLEEELASWAPDTTTAHSLARSLPRSGRDAGVAVAAFDAAAMMGPELGGALLALDDSVYEAMARMAGQQLDTLGDLWSHVQGFASAQTTEAFWSGLPDGTVRKFGGHLGEVFAADHLEGVGVEIAWPNASNQAAFDLLIAGHEVNVKTVADAASLASHFERYPDVPVLVPGDMAGIPADAVHFDGTEGLADVLAALNEGGEHLVLVDHALSHADVMEQAGDALDALAGGVDFGDAAIGVPVVTVALSGVREVGLLREGKTTVGAAVKNAGLDVAGTAGGGAAGAQLGALIGTVIAPGPGTLIGTLLGGLLGGAGGRALTNTVKEAPYQHAMATLRAAQDELRAHAEREQAAARHDAEELIRAQSSHLRTVAAGQRDAVDHEVELLRRWRSDSAMLTAPEWTAWREAALAEIDVVATSVRAGLVRRPWWRRHLWPDAPSQALRDAVRELDRRRAAVQQFDRSVDRGAWLDRGQAWDLLASCGVARSAIEADVRVLETARRERESAVRQRIEEARLVTVEARVGCLHAVRAGVLSLRRRVEVALMPFVTTMNDAEEVFRVEARRLGRA